MSRGLLQIVDAAFRNLSKESKAAAVAAGMKSSEYYVAVTVREFDPEASSKSYETVGEESMTYNIFPSNSTDIRTINKIRAAIMMNEGIENDAIVRNKSSVEPDALVRYDLEGLDKPLVVHGVIARAIISKYHPGKVGLVKNSNGKTSRIPSLRGLLLGSAPVYNAKGDVIVEGSLPSPEIIINQAMVARGKNGPWMQLVSIDTDSHIDEALFDNNDGNPAASGSDDDEE